MVKARQKAVVLENVSYRYDDDTGLALKDINLVIHKGKFTVITGQSGSGKSSIAKCINGLIPNFYPNGRLEGKAITNGKITAERQLQDMCEDVVTVFQDPRSQFFTTNSTTEIAFGCENIKLPLDQIQIRIGAVADAFGIRNLLNRNLFELSSGEKQKIAIASVYAMAPSIFVMDEPSANLDIRSTLHIKKILGHLKRAGHTIIVVEHRLYYIKDLADQLIYMKDGEIKGIWNASQLQALKRDNLYSKGLRSIDLNTILLEGEDSDNGIESLCIENLCFEYTKGKPVVEDINFTANHGQVIGIVGENGCGKTTFAKLVCGLLTEKSGSISINGSIIKPNKRCRLTYLIMQDADFQLFAESVEAELQIGLKKNKQVREKAEEVLSRINLIAERKVHPAALSGGQKQRVTIGAAIMSENDIILFDEPTSGLDQSNMNRLADIIKLLVKEGKTIVLISHDYEFLMHCASRIVHMKDGRIKEDFLLKSETVSHLKSILFPVSMEMKDETQ